MKKEEIIAGIIGVQHDCYNGLLVELDEFAGRSPTNLHYPWVWSATLDWFTLSWNIRCDVISPLLCHIWCHNCDNRSQWCHIKSMSHKWSARIQNISEMLDIWQKITSLGIERCQTALINLFKDISVDLKCNFLSQNVQDYDVTTKSFPGGPETPQKHTLKKKVAIYIYKTISFCDASIFEELSK